MVPMRPSDRRESLRATVCFGWGGGRRAQIADKLIRPIPSYVPTPGRKIDLRNQFCHSIRSVAHDDVIRHRRLNLRQIVLGGAMRPAALAPVASGQRRALVNCFRSGRGACATNAFGYVLRFCFWAAFCDLGWTFA